MPSRIIHGNPLGWRLPLALFFYCAALVGFVMGVSVTERPDLVTSDFLTKAYYSLGLFVMGGLDLGIPTGGPLIGRFLLWLSYFGAPILAATALIEAIVKTLSPQNWQLRHLNNHIIIVGSDELTLSYLKVLRSNAPKIQVVVVEQHIAPIREEQIKQQFNAKVIVGDITNCFFLKLLQLDKVNKVLFLSRDNFQSYEAANKMLRLVPSLENKIIIQCDNIRFMRTIADSRVARKTTSFNSFHLAAAGLVQDHLVWHFLKTAPKDVVVIAGFGIFGQTILEELQKKAEQEIDTIAIVDLNAETRVQVVDEQLGLNNFCHRKVFEGNISNPKVWKKLFESVDLAKCAPVIILATGSTEENLRTALWLRKKYPNAMMIVRSNKESEFAKEIGEEHNFISVSITKLIEDNIPKDWVIRE